MIWQPGQLPWYGLFTMAIGIDPTIDFAFKKLLGSPEHPEITIHFLNAVLGDSRRIVSVEFLNPILDQENDQDKLSVLDIHAKDDLGRSLNIEMQTRVAAGLRERLTYYVSCLYVGQLEKGEHYKTLRPAISICVLNGVLFPEVSNMHLVFCLQDAQTGLVFTKNLQIHLIELPKYNPERGSMAGATPLEKWVYFFRFAAKLTAQEIAGRLTDPEFAQAAGVLEMIARTPRERELYEARIKMERDVIAKVEYAKTEGWEKGHQEGRQEGREEGLEEGIEKGREKGLEIGLEAGRVRMLQQLLGLPETPSSELAAMSLDQLSGLAARLQAQLRDRR